MRPLQMKILPGQGAEEQRRNWNQKTVSKRKRPEEFSDAPYAAENPSRTRALKRRDGTGIRETELE